jgi:streptogramin lyase
MVGRKEESLATIFRFRSRLVTLLTAMVACAGSLSLGVNPALAAAGTVTEFPVNITPYAITFGPDGNLWFAELGANTIGKITPLGGIATAKSHPEGVTAGPDGNVWFVEESGSKIGRITTS